VLVLINYQSGWIASTSNESNSSPLQFENSGRDAEALVGIVNVFGIPAIIGISMN